MSPNVGSIDKILRIIIGLVLIALPFVSGMAMFEASMYKIGAIVVGLVLVGTAFINFCPLYKIIGASTRGKE